MASLPVGQAKRGSAGTTNVGIDSHDIGKEPDDKAPSRLIKQDEYESEQEAFHVAVHDDGPLPPFAQSHELPRDKTANQSETDAEEDAKKAVDLDAEVFCREVFRKDAEGAAAGGGNVGGVGDGRFIPHRVRVEGGEEGEESIVGSSDDFEFNSGGGGFLEAGNQHMMAHEHLSHLGKLVHAQRHEGGGMTSFGIDSHDIEKAVLWNSRLNETTVQDLDVLPTTLEYSDSWLGGRGYVTTSLLEVCNNNFQALQDLWEEDPETFKNMDYFSRRFLENILAPLQKIRGKSRMLREHSEIGNGFVIEMSLKVQRFLLTSNGFLVKLWRVQKRDADEMSRARHFALCFTHSLEQARQVVFDYLDAWSDLLVGDNGAEMARAQMDMDHTSFDTDSHREAALTVLRKERAQDKVTKACRLLRLVRQAPLTKFPCFPLTCQLNEKIDDKEPVRIEVDICSKSPFPDERNYIHKRT